MLTKNRTNSNAIQTPTSPPLHLLHEVSKGLHGCVSESAAEIYRCLDFVFCVLNLQELLWCHIKANDGSLKTNEWQLLRTPLSLAKLVPSKYSCNSLKHFSLIPQSPEYIMVRELSPLRLKNRRIKGDIRPTSLFCLTNQIFFLMSLFSSQGFKDSLSSH